ncbi:MAG TPA: hypothetical protein VFK97_00325 [Candidatus Saccharimonadales bacterium]|nr:hypothetical protein [Candidatus Saccharimonadales bacterium]
MHSALLITVGLGLVLEALATGIFLRGQLTNQEMKVHPVTWFGLSAVMTVGTWSSRSSGATWGTSILWLMTAGTWLVFIISLWHLWRNPKRVYPATKLDLGLLVFGLVLLAARAIGLPPLWSAVAAVVGDSCFLWPTLRELWDDPTSAGWHGKWNWTLATVATVLAVFSLEKYTVASMLYPIYIIGSTGLVAAACWGWAPSKDQYHRFKTWRKTHFKGRA